MLLNRFLKYINYLIAVLLGLTLAAVYWFAWRVLPRTSGEILAPLQAPAQLARSPHGIIHIRAAGIEDAIFLQGYATAQDRLFQLEFMRRQAAGTLAELFGQGALESDLASRRLRLARLALQYTPALQPDERMAFSAYARGVNFFLETHQSALPVEFSLLRVTPAPWTQADCVLVLLHMYRNLSSSWEQDRNRQLILASGSADLAQYLFRRGGGQEALSGSNAWAIHGSRTRSGKPLLAGDPHLRITLPGIWHQVHLEAPGLNVAGGAIPGLPGVIIGRNQRIAWSMTTLAFDVQDLYEERIDAGAGSYTFRGQSFPLIQEREMVYVRDRPAVPLLLLRTRHGPVVLSEGGRFYALRWTAAESFAFPTLDINRASNWSEFRQALRRFHGPPHNFVFAGVDGDIGYQAAGLLPVRRGFRGDLPVDGASGDFEWDGFIPFDALPSIRNPPSGIVVSANQDPFPNDYPYPVHGRFSSPYRARQIRDILSARKDWTMEEMPAVQKDVYSPYLHFLARRIAAACRNRPDPLTTQAARRLEAWNGQMELGAPEPLLITLAEEALRRKVAERAFAGAARQFWGEVNAASLERLLRERPGGWFPDYDALLAGSLADALREGVKRFGPAWEKWDYGKFNRLAANHPVVSQIPLLAWIPWLSAYPRLGPVAISGAGTTVKQVSPSSAPSMRMVTDLGYPDGFLMTLPAGQSGQPLSPHYKDQWEAWYNGRALHFPYAKAEDKHVLNFRPE